MRVDKYLQPIGEKGQTSQAEQELQRNEGPETDEPVGALLSLDEVPYDRDLRWCNQANSSRPRRSIGKGSRFYQQISGITQSALSEFEQLDAHYKRLDQRKVLYDAQAGCNVSANCVGGFNANQTQGRMVNGRGGGRSQRGRRGGRVCVPTAPSHVRTNTPKQQTESSIPLPKPKAPFLMTNHVQGNSFQTSPEVVQPIPLQPRAFGSSQPYHPRHPSQQAPLALAVISSGSYQRDNWGLSPLSTPRQVVASQMELKRLNGSGHGLGNSLSAASPIAPTSFGPLGSNSALFASERLSSVAPAAIFEAPRLGVGAVEFDDWMDTDTLGDLTTDDKLSSALDTDEMISALGLNAKATPFIPNLERPVTPSLFHPQTQSLLLRGPNTFSLPLQPRFAT